MPEIKIVRLALDRMKNLGPKLLITGYSDGKVHFSVESYNVKSTVKFGDLRIFNLGKHLFSDVILHYKSS